jgi:hypothetical protein
MNKESKFNHTFRLEMTQQGFYMIRVESHSTSPGIPDNHFVCPDGVSGWVEIKQTPTYPRGVPFEPKQAVWHYTYAVSGGLVSTVMYVQDTHEVIWIPGRASLQAEKDWRTFGVVFPIARHPEVWEKIAGKLRERF